MTPKIDPDNLITVNERMDKKMFKLLVRLIEKKQEIPYDPFKHHLLSKAFPGFLYPLMLWDKELKEYRTLLRFTIEAHKWWWYKRQEK